MYSIQKYVLKIMKEKSIRKSVLVKRLGYKNISKGIRRFDSFIKGDYYNKHFINSLHIALEIPGEEIDLKLRDTEQQIQQEIDLETEKRTEFERRSFVPYLFCHTERRIPSPIFICAMMGSDRMKIQKLPLNFNSLSSDEKITIRKKLIEETGYSNITKGLRRLKEFEVSGNIEGLLFIKIVLVLNIQDEELNQLLYNEKLIVEENKFYTWKSNVILPRNSLAVCNNCIFLKKLERQHQAELFVRRGMCTHPLLNESTLYINIAKYKGYNRPESCPLGYKKYVESRSE